jgi:tetratricopeptide (TPR) repeat protein
MFWVVALVALVAPGTPGALLSPRVAHADPPRAEASASDKSRAAELFKESVAAYRQGDLKHAVELLDEAYRLDPQPVLLYNRARAEEGLGDLDAAISHYETYLQQEPNAVDRGAIEQRLVTLRHQREERQALAQEREQRAAAPPAPAPATSAPPPEAPPAERRSNVLPYVVGGAGVVGIGVGALLGALALGKHDDAVKEPVQTKAMDDKSSADGLATGSTVSFIVGGVLLAAGVTWWVLNRRSSAQPASALVGPKDFVLRFGGPLR